MNKPHKPLTPHERIAVNAIADGASQKDAYRLGWKSSERWSATTLAIKVRSFFGTKRIKHFIDLAFGRIKDLPVVIDRDEVFAQLPKLMGRPTEFYPEIVEDMITYFDIEAFENVEYTNEKTGVMSYTVKLSYFPTLAGFCAKIKISRQTLHRWSKELDFEGKIIHPEFAEAFMLAKDFQENILVTNTLLGQYQPSFASLVAKNLLNWDKDGEKVAEVEKPLTLISEDMTPEQAALNYKESLDNG